MRWTAHLNAHLQGVAMHIYDALQRFSLQLVANGRSPHTIGQYRRHVTLLAAGLAELGHSGEVEDIDDGDIAAFLASGRARMTAAGTPRAANSGNALRTSIKGFCRYAHQVGLVKQDPARLVRRALCAPPPPRGIRPAEQDRLLEVLRAAGGAEGRRDRVLVEVMLASGIRLSSALGLDLEDVDLDEGILRLRGAKGGRELSAYLPQRACDLLRDFLGDRTTGPVFGNAAGRRLTTRHVQRRFRTWREAARVSASVTPHSLRHSFATDLYRRTGNILLVSRGLGHSSIGSTTVYARATDADVRAAVQV